MINPDSTNVKSLLPAYNDRLRTEQKTIGNRIDQWIVTHIPSYRWNPLRFDIGLARRQSRRLKHYKREFTRLTNAMINIGSGYRGKEGWVNVDICNAPSVNCTMDCRRILPFPDGSAKGIFTEHFFEHLDIIEDIPHFLDECFRVLKPGGQLRIIVPDAEKYLKAYIERDWSAMRKLRHMNQQNSDGYITGIQYLTLMEVVNEVFRQGTEHLYTWDAETLVGVLEDHGFSEIEKTAYQVTRLNGLAIDSEDRKEESLYIEAVKPC